MTALHDYGGLLLGSRLKRVSESLYASVDEVYRAHGVRLSSRCFPILFLLRDNGPMAITALASQLGQSHPAVSQMSRKLLRYGVVAERTDRTDERRRLLALSPKGAALMGRMPRIWQAIVGAVDQLNATMKVDLLEVLAAVDMALATRDFAQRIGDRLREDDDAVEIIPFEPRYRRDFKRLNVEWLEKYFHVEPIDRALLSHPEKRILEPGGFILLARRANEIVGTCALVKAGPRRFELSKMAVTERHQGRGIGRRLLTAAIQQFRATRATELFLESNRRLTPALRLYAEHGFRHARRPKGASHYARADVYMILRRDQRSRSRRPAGRVLPLPARR